MTLVYGYKHLNKKSVSLAEPKSNIFSQANFKACNDIRFQMQQKLVFQ